MRWHDVQKNWPAFVPALMERWPDAEEEDLIGVDGDQARFIALVATVTGQSAEDAAEEVRDWTEGALPADVVLDEHHDNASINDAARYVPPGEEPLDDDRRFGDDDAAEPPVGRD
jgi:hypothetical protein